MSGTAGRGTDYNLNASSPITVKAGQSQVSITLTALKDKGENEKNEPSTTAILTLQPGTGYSLVNPISETITILP